MTTQKYKYKSFYLTPNDVEMLKYLGEVYGCNHSMLIRKLITEAYSIIKFVKQGKIDE